MTDYDDAELQRSGPQSRRLGYVLKENLIAIRELIGKHRTTFDPKEVCRRADAGGCSSPKHR